MRFEGWQWSKKDAEIASIVEWSKKVIWGE